MQEFRFGFADLGTVTLHHASIGDPSAPLIICLHGFPEYWAAWKGVMRELADDFRLVAPDQRGYNLSSKPATVEDYRVRHMVADLDALAARLSPDRPFVLAGHDWGASVAYAYAIQKPQRVSRLVIANGIHPACFQRAIFEDDEQRAASQYMNRLREPDAETRMAEDGFRRTLRMIEGFSRTDWMTDDEKQSYVEAWGQPGAMKAMLDWYRASPVAVPAPGEPAGESMILSMPREALTVAMPHLVVWGDADEALRPSCLDGLADYAPQLDIVRVPGAGHWILHEKPAAVAAAMRGFSQGPDA